METRGKAGGSLRVSRPPVLHTSKRLAVNSSKVFSVWPEMLKEEGSNPSRFGDASSCRSCSCCRRGSDCWRGESLGAAHSPQCDRQDPPSPTPAAGSQVAPVRRGLYCPGVTPPTVRLQSWQILGSPHEVNQGVTEKVPVCVPTHSWCHRCQSLQRSSRTAMRIGGPGDSTRATSWNGLHVPSSIREGAQLWDRERMGDLEVHECALQQQSGWGGGARSCGWGFGSLLYRGGAGRELP